MFLFLITYWYELLLLLAAIAGLWRWRISDLATRIFTVVLMAAFITEVAALPLAIVYRNNLYLFRVFSPLELLGYSLYLNYCVPQLGRYAIGWVVGITGIIAGIAFEVMFPQDVRGQRFLMVESVLIICGCLYACFTMMLRENDEPPTRYFHFWLLASLLFFWCFSFLSLALLNTDPAQKTQNAMLQQLVQVGNFVMLTGILLAFIRLPKLLPAS